MKKYLPVILLLLLVPISVNAQSLLTEWLNIPADWTRPPNIIYYVFIPFLGTFVIIWGILTATRAKIFEDKKVNALLSFIFAIALFYSGIMPAIVLYLFNFGGFFGVIAFFVLFFVLTFLFGARKVGIEYKKTKEVYEDIPREDMDRTIKNLKTKFKETDKVGKKIRELEKKIREEEKTYYNLLRQADRIPAIRDKRTLIRRYGVGSQSDTVREIQAKVLNKILRRLNAHKERRMQYLKKLRRLEEQYEELM